MMGFDYYSIQSVVKNSAKFSRRNKFSITFTRICSWYSYEMDSAKGEFFSVKGSERTLLKISSVDVDFNSGIRVALYEVGSMSFRDMIRLK